MSTTTYTQTGKVVLFKNANKQKDNHPDYTGNVEVDGIKHRLSGWNRTDKNGNSYISGALSVSDEGSTETVEGDSSPNSDEIASADDLF